MIFFYFTSSLGPLEPELALFKDLKEIGSIWEISLTVGAVQLQPRHQEPKPPLGTFSKGSNLDRQKIVKFKLTQIKSSPEKSVK